MFDSGSAPHWIASTLGVNLGSGILRKSSRSVTQFANSRKPRKPRAPRRLAMDRAPSLTSSLPLRAVARMSLASFSHIRTLQASSSPSAINLRASKTSLVSVEARSASRCITKCDGSDFLQSLKATSSCCKAHASSNFPEMNHDPNCSGSFRPMASLFEANSEIRHSQSFLSLSKTSSGTSPGVRCRACPANLIASLLTPSVLRSKKWRMSDVSLSRGIKPRR